MDIILSHVAKMTSKNMRYIYAGVQDILPNGLQASRGGSSDARRTLGKPVLVSTVQVVHIHT